MIVAKMIWMVQHDSRGRVAYIPSSAQRIIVANVFAAHLCKTRALLAIPGSNDNLRFNILQSGPSLSL
jgi:hypothetical protein